MCEIGNLWIKLSKIWHLDCHVDLVTIAERMTSRKREKDCSWPVEWKKKRKQKWTKAVNVIIVVEFDFSIQSKHDWAGQLRKLNVSVWKDKTESWDVRWVTV